MEVAYLYLMKNSELSIQLIQSDLSWEDKEKNIGHFTPLIKNSPWSHIILLPEMFSTGFSMNPKPFAETMQGHTVQWMLQCAIDKKSIIAGSIIIEEAGNYYNRLIWAMPNGQLAHYDKRHLFSFAGENLHYSPGQKRLIAQVNGWKICLNICYDLRFPVWARNTDDYDILVYIANWPQQRNEAWESLLKARAIENLSYCIGVNRIGTDANNNQYIGNSSIYDPLGNLITKCTGEEQIITYQFSKQELEQVRKKFPFLDDRDPFMIR